MWPRTRTPTSKIRDRADKPGFIDGGVLAVLSNMDTNLSPSELFRIAQAVAQVDRSKITGCVVQGSIGIVGGASVVFPNTSAARAYGRDARQDATIRHC